MQPKPQLRIGYGVDVHQLAAGYPLWIGGIQLPSELGAVGHSDADVLIHAICDALLGALALRDIGYSKILLTRVIDLVKGKGYAIVNIDATVILESPKVNPHIAQMQEVLAAILEIQTDEISIKATTHEKVDSFGEKRAIKAYAAALLYQI